MWFALVAQKGFERSGDDIFKGVCAVGYIVLESVFCFHADWMFRLFEDSECSGSLASWPTATGEGFSLAFALS